MLATIVGVGGMGFWVLADPPMILRGFEEWRLSVLFAALVLIPAGVVDRLQRPASDHGAMAVTAGVVGVLVLWFVPVRDVRFIDVVTGGLKETSRMTWPQTAVLVWFLVPPLAAATALLCWRPGRSRRTLLGTALIVAIWLGMLQGLFDLMFIAQLYGWDAVMRQPFAVLLPLQLVLYGALAALAPTEVIRAVHA